MSDAVLISMVGLMASIASAAITGFVSIQLAKVARAVDGMSSNLVAATERGASAEGQLQGRKEATAEAAEIATVVAQVAATAQDAAVVQAEVNATAAEKQQAAAVVQQAAADTQQAAADQVTQRAVEERGHAVGETPNGTTPPKTNGKPG